MSFSLLFPGVDRRTALLRAVLLSACFLGLLASTPVWLNSRTFPLCPIASGFPILPFPWDKYFFGTMLFSLVLAAWFYRAAVIFFLCASFFAFCEDQNRGQPWFYMYWVMLLFTLLPAPAPIAACRVAISVAYIWSGIQKFNSRFFEVAPAWFVAPAARWHFPSGIIELLRWGVASAPFLELAIGLALWSLRLRRAAIGAVLVLHLVSLLFLGPAGHNYNVVVWPWNLAMIGLVCALFWERRATKIEPPGQKSKELPTPKPEPLLKKTFAELRRSKPAMIILALYSCLPILSFFGKWDSGFSFSLYSENLATANVFVSQSFGDRLPPKLRSYVQPFSQDYDPDHQGPCLFVFQLWGYDELRVPPISEPRNFRFVFNFLRAYSKEPGDLRMIVGTRGGRVIFFENDRYEFLTPER